MRCIHQRLAARTPKSLKKYQFFEDHYPKPSSGPGYEYFEDQLNAGYVKSLERKPVETESEKLQRRHKKYTITNNSIEFQQDFGWREEWGPEPGQDGHNDWYSKGRTYMSFDEKVKFDMRHGVPIEKNYFRHQSLPYHRRQSASYSNIVEANPSNSFDSRARNWEGKYSYEEKKEIAISKDNYLNEWLQKPGVTRENLPETLSKYHGTDAKHRRVNPPIKPEWNIAPLHNDFDD
jgi:hypothetical protein